MDAVADNRLMTTFNMQSLFLECEISHQLDAIVIYHKC